MEAKSNVVRAAAAVTLTICGALASDECGALASAEVVTTKYHIPTPGEITDLLEGVDAGRTRAELVLRDAATLDQDPDRPQVPSTVDPRLETLVKPILTVFQRYLELYQALKDLQRVLNYETVTPPIKLDSTESIYPSKFPSEW
ncbi:MAG: hypothetical protein LBF65_02745 [Holosporales bacterium]|jgi:hypothetical protein|nr:hypothetical protein [Holosporales bacterium]